QVAGRVPARLHRLCVTAIAGGAHLDLRSPGGELHRQCPFAEGVFAEITAKPGRYPGLAAVDRDRNLLDAGAAVEGDALQPGPSMPLKVTCLAPACTPAMSSTAFSGTPRQRALPIAPLPNCPPATRGSKNPRLLPEHWLTATSSTAFSLRRSFSDNFSGRST